MSEYSAPLRDMRFILDEVANFDVISSLPGYEEATPDLVDAVLEEANKLASEVLAPLNQSGDEQGSRLENGVVVNPEGFADAHAQFVESGWGSLPFDPEFGGQGLPFTLGAPLLEMWASANMGYSLLPLLTQGGIDAIGHYGTPEQKATYLENLVTGKWSGTMNLTEPQAGSDVGAVKTKAEVQLDGSYKITGTKIFITWGDHELSENILHLVLARLPDAPGGTKGISCFIVPKYLVNEDGSIGERNDLRCVSLEHKLGIHASPTAVMSFGDNGGATGYLLGPENGGMRVMFVMMNNARFGVGMEGVAIAERSYQHALAYAKERVQGRVVGGGQDAAIVDHPDVRRMLMQMKALTEASRALAYYAASQNDLASHHENEVAREAANDRLALLTPLVKAWSTDIGVEVASLGVQVHGGMGFIEETGAAQYYRDSRIAPIYEGTNGIQALDLVGRKLPLAGGATVGSLFAEISGTAAELQNGDMAEVGNSLALAHEALVKATEWISTGHVDDPRAKGTGATNYLKMFSTVVGGWLMGRAALAASRKLAASEGDAGFYKAKIATTRFYAEQILSQVPGLLSAVTSSSEATFAIDPEQMTG
ncbi:MAG: acyl-CoA dehydrogenase [Alphaproteobacteria bacterium]|nr:acyl-CoA dehydrogenase [Alphaproteobacteria bacterium]